MSSGVGKDEARISHHQESRLEHSSVVPFKPLLASGRLFRSVSSIVLDALEESNHNDRERGSGNALLQVSVDGVKSLSFCGRVEFKRSMAGVLYTDHLTQDAFCTKVEGALSSRSKTMRNTLRKSQRQETKTGLQPINSMRPVCPSLKQEKQAFPSRGSSFSNPFPERPERRMNPKIFPQKNPNNYPALHPLPGIIIQTLTSVGRRVSIGFLLMSQRGSTRCFPGRGEDATSQRFSRAPFPSPEASGVPPSSWALSAGAAWGSSWAQIGASGRSTRSTDIVLSA